MERMQQIIEVRVSRDNRAHSGTHWHLFAQYPNQYEAHMALDRAKAQGYSLARIVEHVTFSLESRDIADGGIHRVT